jgi:energy-coupling factor transport system substrate-specific component
MAQAQTTPQEGFAQVPPFFGARISLYPMSDRYIPIILDAIKGLDRTGLEVETDDVSTFLGGDRDQVFAELERIFAAAARTREHVVMTVLLSHGCPGETYCEATGEIRAPRTAPPTAAKSGVSVACQWSLYPLGVDGYMDVIYREIDRTKKAGVFAKGQHFVSSLRGDLTDVLAAVRMSFDAACADAGHVVAHATFSANSPTGRSSDA